MNFNEHDGNGSIVDTYQIPDPPEVVAYNSQRAKVEAFTAGAANLVSDIQAKGTTLASARSTFLAAASTFQTARTTYLAIGTPSAAQIDTYLTAQSTFLTAQHTYITALHDSVFALGGGLIDTVRGVANFVNSHTGSTAVVSGP